MPFAEPHKFSPIPFQPPWNSEGEGATCMGRKGACSQGGRGSCQKRGAPPEILRPLCEAGGEEANYRMPSSAGQTYGGQEWGGRRKRGQNTEKRGK